MIKLKDILKESYVWERKFGESLPTLADVQQKYNEEKLAEGKIESDVNTAFRKVGIKFKKETKVVTTNKFSNPKGDIKKMGKDKERIKMNSWFSDDKSITKQNYKEVGKKLQKLLASKYVVVDKKDYADTATVTYMNRKKDPKSEFKISYASTISGPYVAYTGVKGV